MHRFWNSIIEPIFSILNPRIVVEIGSSEGDNTRKLLQYCHKHNGTLHSIDPLPKFDVAFWQGVYGKHPVFRQIRLCPRQNLGSRIGCNAVMMVATVKKS